jgi:hypothetical protein
MLQAALRRKALQEWRCRPKKPARLRLTRRRRARSSAVEHLTFNQVVVGSIPTGLTIKSLKNKKKME